MDKQQANTLEEIVERSRATLVAQATRQPRFRDGSSFMHAWMQFVEKIEDTPPQYKADSRELDRYLLRLSRSEPLLSSILFQVTTRDKNRGWTLTGAKSTAERYSAILHNLHAGKGWRYFTGMASNVYRTTNVGMVAEIGYSNDGYPAMLWMVDPTRITLHNNPNMPVRYHKSYKGLAGQYWRPEYFIHALSMPSPEEEFQGLGFSAVMRVVTLTRLMVGVNYYQLEKLGLRPPRGYLLFKGINEPRKKRAEKNREQEQDELGTEYYDDVQAIYAGENAGIDFVSLSQVPDAFGSFDQSVQTVMKIYAAAFGEIANDIFTIDSNNMSRGKEMEVQTDSASNRGYEDFIADYQEQLQRILPKSVSHEFDERDDRGDLIRAQAAQTWASLARSLVAPTGNITEDGQPETLITIDQAREFAAIHGVIPSEWADAENEVVVTDVQRLRRKVRHLRSARTAAELYPAEPLIQIHYPTGRQVTIYDRADELFKPVHYAVPRLPATRRNRLADILAERESVIRATLYEPDEEDDPLTQIEDEDVDRAISKYGNVDDDLKGLLEADAVDTADDLPGIESDES